MEQTMLDIERVSQALKLLGDKTRLSIVSILKQRECCVCEFLEVFDMSQPSISQHLRKLKDAGLVKEERRGQWIYYSLNTQTNLYDLIEDVLKHVPDPDEKIQIIQKCSLNTCCDE
ncbi:metalloregulator ArsR/SmtB family transcription factor [Bacillus sp. 165]|uniref:ArsR/SmtB family transcription factor n=1 Tax=Bacillus sp. 165 TaxID=1529117 RepID=UPI001AD9BD22|nr:metalloregulator ArsR/SmtB family transcription factor [Bacillus sp. 165]MBO9129421.1 winged helix-turn-helix transcriptional regulator [Bacillus sp. 165]